MRLSGDLRAHLLAGGAVGFLGVALFGVAHAVTIVPIWRNLLEIVPFAVIAGTAIGWAWHETRLGGGYPASVWRGARFGILLWLALVPMTAIGAALRLAGLHRPEAVWEPVLQAAVAFAAGAVAGWWYGRGPRAGLASGVATLSLALAMGGPIAVTNSVRASGLFVAFAGVYALSGAILVLAGETLSRWIGARPGPAHETGASGRRWPIADRQDVGGPVNGENRRGGGR